LKGKREILIHRDENDTERRKSETVRHRLRSSLILPAWMTEQLSRDQKKKENQTGAIQTIRKGGTKEGKKRKKVKEERPRGVEIRRQKRG